MNMLLSIRLFFSIIHTYCTNVYFVTMSQSHIFLLFIIYPYLKSTKPLCIKKQFRYKKIFNKIQLNLYMTLNTLKTALCILLRGEYIIILFKLHIIFVGTMSYITVSHISYNVENIH